MKLFIIGATGVLGKRVIKNLVETHEIHCLVRSDSKKQEVEKLGAIGHVGDLYDKISVVELTKDIDGLLHLATSIPQKEKTKPNDWTENNRLRTEAVSILIEAVKINGIQFYIHNDVLFSYGQRKGEWVDESVPLTRPMPSYYKMSDEWRYVLESAIEGEELLHKEIMNGFSAIILRFGMFYSSDSYNTLQILDMVKKGKFPIIGDGSSYVNFIHVDDAAQAVTKTVANYDAIIGMTFNISDDTPATYDEVLPFIAKKLNVKKPRKVPPFLAKLVAGKYTVNLVLSSFRNKNDSFKEKTGWKPFYPSYKEGFEQILEELQYGSN